MDKKINWIIDIRYLDTDGAYSFMRMQAHELYAISVMNSKDGIPKTYIPKNPIDREETIFPELEEGVFNWVNEEKTEGWFKRCMTDRPIRKWAVSIGEWANKADAWFEKWFSQFKEETTN